MSSSHKDHSDSHAKAQPAKAAHNVPASQPSVRMNARVDQPSNRPVAPAHVVPAPMPATHQPDPVTPQPQAPAITSVATAMVTRGDSFKYQIEGTHNPTVFAADGLPTGLAIDPKGLISGKPDDRGVYPIHLSASNTVGRGDMTLTVTVV